MNKRAGLARAMSLDPKILFFDEPSAGLDPINSRNLDRLILQLRDGLGATFVIVTHELCKHLRDRRQLDLSRHEYADDARAGQSARAPEELDRSVRLEILTRGEARLEAGTETQLRSSRP